MKETKEKIKIPGNNLNSLEFIIRKSLDRKTFDEIINKYDIYRNASKKELDELYKSFVELFRLVNEK